MDTTTSIFKLEGKVQHYAWGGVNFIPALLHRDNPGQKPCAEYWMGAHDNVPSVIILPDGSRQPLNEFIKSDPAAILGKPVNNRFGRLPYLFKVLDVKDMLSIQVHPSKEAAVKEFEAENRSGKPLNAPDRNYKDDNHKPELMLALGDFWLLHGYKPADSLQQILHQTPELQFLLPVFDGNNYKALYETVMNMQQQEVNAHLQPLLDRIVPLYGQGMLNRSSEDFWAARAALTFNEPGKIDRGIFSVYLFNLVHLGEGESIFQDAGIPHAYLEGQNMEIMANSDNVLRGGLTPKHIDVAELMKHVRFEAVTPEVIKGQPAGVPEDLRFPTPVFDFELHQVQLKKGASVTLKTVTAEIYLVYTGNIQAQGGDVTLALAGGEAMLAIAGADITLRGLEDAIIFRATVPVELS